MPDSKANGNNDKDIDLLLTFVHDRDINCPRCGYNLRSITRPVCPECGQNLHLTINTDSITMRWFLLAIASGFCSAGFLTLLIIDTFAYGIESPDQIYLIVYFGFMTILSIGICFYRKKYLRQTIAKQKIYAALFWFSQIIVFAYIMMWQ